MAITETIVAPIWPQIEDGTELFDQKSDALAPQLIDIQDQMNTYATQANALAIEVNGYQVTASAAAVSAANAQAAAEGFRDEAEGFKNDSQAILDSNTVIAAAVQSAAGLPSLIGSAGLALVVNETEDGVLWGSSGGERLSFTKSFSAGEERTYALDGEALIPVVSITKEVAQVGESNNQWDADVGGYEQQSSLLNIGSTITIEDLGGGTYTDNQYIPAITNSDGQINTTFWTDINSMAASETLNGQTINYALSNDGRGIWQIGLTGGSPRNIVRNNGGTWEYNSDATYAGETWAAASVNTEFDALSEAMEGAAGSVGFILSDASYDNVSFSVNTQDATPQSLAFSTDGTKMFVLGGANSSIYQYTLTTGFDVSTASYDSVSFSVAGQESSPYSLEFNSNGTKMFVLGIANDTVYQYTLSTSWNVGTSSYDSIGFSVNAQEPAPFGLAFSTDGTKMFVVGNTNDSVFQYTLTTGFDVSTASYDSISFSVSSQDASPQSLAFNNDGTKMFIAGNTNDSVYQYTLSTGFDVSTASYDNVSFSVNTQDATPQSLAFSTDGTKMFVVGNTNDSVYQYTTESLVYQNQMDSTQLQALTDAEQIVLGNELDLAVILFTDDNSVTPSFSGMTIDYDANIKNQAAILGTDYEWWSYEGTDITIKALADNNLKGRVL